MLAETGRKSIVQIFLKREELTSTKGIRKETLLFIMPVRRLQGHSGSAS